MPGELVQLAQLAGQTVVAAASTDAWGRAKAGFGRLLGRGDLARSQMAETRLEDMRGELAGLSGMELASHEAIAAAAWQARLEYLLDEHPSLAADVRALVAQIRAQLPATEGVTASGHGLAVGGNLTISASGSGVAAGVIHGSVKPDPTGPGPAS